MLYGDYDRSLNFFKKCVKKLFYFWRDVKMAKPIGRTPTLEGVDAKAVLDRMNDSPTEKDIGFSKRLAKSRAERRVHLGK
jgi:hypothetical protein